MPWVTLRSIKQIRERGESKIYHPGDSVNVGKQTALQWILDGSAIDPFAQVGPNILPEDASDTEYSVRVMATEGSVSLEDIGVYAESLPVSYGYPELTNEYTCIWRPSKRMSPAVLNYGFLRITQGSEEAEAWEMAAMLKSLTDQAKDFGPEDEQRRTLKVIGDLRFPVYDARLVWARRTPASEAVIEQWTAELKEKADLYHSFLRALYTNHAMLCTLPMDWAGP